MPSSSSDSELPPIRFEEGMEPDEILEHGQRALEQIDILQQRLAEKRTIDEVEGRSASPPAQRRNVQDPSDDHSDTENDKQAEHFERVISYAGKTFAIMNVPFLNRAFTFDAELRENWRPETKYRFANSDNIAQGQLRDVLELTPEYADARKEVKFQDTFLAGLKEERDKFGNRLRESPARDKIFGKVRTQHFDDPEARREHFKEELGWDEGEGGYKPIDAPFHHKGGEAPDGYNPATAFRGLIPKKVFAALAFGPASVRSVENGHVVAAKGSHMAKVLHLKYTTPGAIVTSTILGFWAMSPDGSFVEEGSESGMNYSEMADEFLKVLLEGLQMRKKSTLELFAEWDSIFFPRTKDQGLSARAGLPDADTNRSLASRATDRAMMRLNQDEQVPEQDEEQDGN